MRRTRKYILLLLAPAALVLALTATAASAQQAGARGGAHASVIGGASAPIEDFPWLAFIQGDRERGAFGFSCSGSVVAPRVVLTAGHCVENLESLSVRLASGYQVVTGAANLKTMAGATIASVSRALVYPGFNTTKLHGDAGLLILSTPTTAPALPLAAASDSALLGAGTPVSVAGWGLTDPEATDVPAQLQSGEMLVQDSGLCRAKTRPFNPFYSPALQLCTLDSPHFKVSGCFGDSGGPLIAHRADGSPAEVGIVSTGGPECDPTLPNIFTRVDQVSSWVAQWIAAVENGGPEPPVKVLNPHPPAMSFGEAKLFVAEALSEGFGHLFLQLKNIDHMRCSRVSRETVKCHVAWTQDGNDYHGSVTVYYAVKRDAVFWSDRYRIRWARDRCLKSPRRRSCQVHTRQVRHPQLKVPPTGLNARATTP